MEENVDYLTRLPDELKIAIFSYLDTFDVVQLCDVSPSLENITYDRDLISTVNLYREYKFSKGIFDKFLLNKVRAEVITSLNINCIYWIPAADLRKCVSRLPMLECLYVVDTKLSCAKTDCRVYASLPKLRVLALTLVEAIAIATEFFSSSLTSLFLHVDIKERSQLRDIAFVLYKFPLLHELWIIDLSAKFYHESRILFDVKNHNLQKLTLMSYNLTDITLKFAFFCSSGWTVMFRNTKANSQMCMGRSQMDANRIYNMWNHPDRAWDTFLNRLKCELPFGQNDAEKLILKKSTLEDLSFEELNMSHNSMLCSKILKYTIGLLLLSPNTKLLKKLSINFCLCEQYSDVLLKTKPLFKRARLGVGDALAIQSILEKIIENSPLIEELEIWECESAERNAPQITHAALASIKNLKHLKKLTLHGIPPHLTCKFLIDVCKSCTKLASLRIHAPKQNNNLNNYLCLALPHTTSLKDFRYEQSYIPIDKVISSLNSIKDSKLERVVLKCQTIEKFTILPFETFVSTNPQLRFLCILISGITKTVIREISRSIKKFGYSAEKVFVVAQDESIYTGRSPIPHIHKMEMLMCKTWVSVLDIFNGFTT